jgi:trimeric autotransporter adhesin
MRQVVPSLFKRQAIWLFLSFTLLGLVAAGCGHSSTPVTPTSITISPASSVSMKFGDVQAISAQVIDNNGNAMTNQKFTWTSSNASLATVTATGGSCGDTLNTTATTCLCGGTWSSDFIYCTPPASSTPGGAPQAGTTTLTVNSDGLSASITVLVHSAVSRVTVAPINVDCLSATGTQQITAKAFDAQGNDITSTVAVDATSFNWSSSDATVVSLDNNGLATAVNPGRARVYASIAGTSSAPGTFTTCPVVSVALALSSGSGNTFSIAQAATQQLTPTVVDSNGKTITVTSGRLTYSSSYGQALSPSSTGLITGLNPGNSAIVASCSPPSCNNGLYPVFSNVINGTTQGTTATGTNSKSTQVIVASTSDTQLIPIDITTNTAGTALTLPYKPNSMVFSRNSGIAYMGSDTILMSYTSSSNTVSGVALIPGVIVDLSNSGNRIVVYDDVTKTVTVYSISNGGIADKFSVPNATPSNVHASTSPDDQTTYVVVGNQLYISSSTNSLRTITLDSPANDVAFLYQGSFAYLAGGENNSVTARTTCDGSQKDIIAVNATPDRIVASGDGSKVFAVAGATMNTITATTNGAGCPPALTDSLASIDLGQGVIAPKEMFSNPAGTKVYMISSAGKVVVYNVSGNTGSLISLSGSGSATSGALTLDGANLWVGGGADKAVHRIDTSTNADAQQITVPISADLVAVKNQ